MTQDAGFRDPVEQGAIEHRGLGIRVARHILRLFFYLIITFFALFLGGFAIFYQHVASLAPPENPKADAIVVLTGGYQRIDQAVELLQSGAGKRLLISGVNPATTGNHIRLLTRSSTTVMRLDDRLRVTPSSALFADLKHLLGPGCLTS